MLKNDTKDITNSALNESLSEIFHEFKNPLAVIKIHLELLEENISKKTFKNFLAIKNEITRIENLIDKYISFSHKNELNKKTLSLNNIMYSVIEEYNKSYPDIEFIVNDNANLELLAFEYHMYMVFSNIIKNSIEAMNSVGKININISNIDGVANIEIVDEGSVGSKKLFDLLKNDSFTTKPNGSGLGTTIIKNIVNIYNGEFYLLANNPKGAKAIVKIPLWNVD